MGQCCPFRNGWAGWPLACWAHEPIQATHPQMDHTRAKWALPMTSNGWPSGVTLKRSEPCAYRDGRWPSSDARTADQGSWQGSWQLAGLATHTKRGPPKNSPTTLPNCNGPMARCRRDHNSAPRYQRQSGPTSVFALGRHHRATAPLATSHNCGGAKRWIRKTVKTHKAQDLLVMALPSTLYRV